MATYAELLKEFKTLAKRADQRLVNLEKASKQTNYSTATKWAYARAEADIRKWAGGVEVDKPRFNRDIPKSKSLIQAKISDIKTFLEAPTSTKRGITETYKQRADTFNAKYGTKLKWQDLASFYRSQDAQNLNERFGSETAAQTIATISKEKKAIRKWLQERAKAEAEGKTLSDPDIVVDDEMIAETVATALTESGIDFSMLIK